MKKKKRRNKYCRLCRHLIKGHGNRFYCDRDGCKARQKVIRKRQLASAKRKYKIDQNKTKARIKTLQKDQRLKEVKSWLKGI